MHALAVSAAASSIAAIEDAIKRLDVPSAAPRIIELMALPGGWQPNGLSSSPPLPKELEGVVSQLKIAFAYKSYCCGRTEHPFTHRRASSEHEQLGRVLFISEGRSPRHHHAAQYRFFSLFAEEPVRISWHVWMQRAVGNARPWPGLPACHRESSPRDSIKLGLTTDADLKDRQKVVRRENGFQPRTKPSSSSSAPTSSNKPAKRKKPAAHAAGFGAGREPAPLPSVFRLPPYLILSSRSTFPSRM